MFIDHPCSYPIHQCLPRWRHERYSHWWSDEASPFTNKLQCSKKFLVLVRKRKIKVFEIIKRSGKNSRDERDLKAKRVKNLSNGILWFQQTSGKKPLTLPYCLSVYSMTVASPCKRGAEVTQSPNLAFLPSNFQNILDDTFWPFSGIFQRCDA